MESLAAFVRLEMWVFFAALLSLVGFRMLTGGINVRGVLRVKDGSGRLSPGRIQLLLFTVVGAMAYLSGVSGDGTAMPDVPRELLILVGGSNVVYLGGKGMSLIAAMFGRSGSNS